MSKKKNRCSAVMATLFTVVSGLLMYWSFLGVTSISKSDHWFAPDYWLAWFSGFALLGAVLSGIVAGVSAADALDCGTEN